MRSYIDGDAIGVVVEAVRRKACSGYLVLEASSKTRQLNIPHPTSLHDAMGHDKSRFG